MLSEFLTHICLLIISFTRPQVNESDADDQDFGDYALDFMAGKKKQSKSSVEMLHLHLALMVCAVTMTIIASASSS